MANKRMFAREVIGSDTFADLSFEAQALYLHLSMEADDWGFVGSPRKVQRSIGSGSDALEELISGELVHMFYSGVVVILDWWRNNTITESRRKATQYSEELESLEETDCGSYYVVCETPANCMQTASKQHASIDKISLDKTSLEEDKEAEPRHKYGEYKNVLLSDEQFTKLKEEFADWNERIEKVSAYCAASGKSYRNYLAVIRNWARKEVANGKDEATERALIFALD